MTGGERGFMPGPLVLVGPSGAGKTSIATRLVAERPDRFVLSVSATTRVPRVGEWSGRDYHFVSTRDFEAMIAEGELVEWARVHGQYYGTPKANLAPTATGGRIVVMDIDVQGAVQVKRHVPSALVIFVVPPCSAKWLKRLTGRSTESSPQILKRLRTALVELEAAATFEEFIVNEELGRTVEQVMAFGCAPVARRTPRVDMRAVCAELASGARLEIARLEGVDGDV